MYKHFAFVRFHLVCQIMIIVESRIEETRCTVQCYANAPDVTLWCISTNCSTCRGKIIFYLHKKKHSIKEYKVYLVHNVNGSTSNKNMSTLSQNSGAATSMKFCDYSNTWKHTPSRCNDPCISTSKPHTRYNMVEVYITILLLHFI